LDAPASEPPRAIRLAILAWVVPSAGHFALGRQRRAALFAVLIVVALIAGVYLHGNLYRPMPGQPLSWLAAAGAMGVGTPYLVLRTVFGYEGDPTAAGFEYGTVFLLSAGLMNILLVLDTWDIATGRKE